MKMWKPGLALVALCVALWPGVGIQAESDIVTVVAFNPSRAEAPENLIFDHRGNLYLNMALTGEIRKIAPDGTQSTLATLRVGAGRSTNALLGLAVDRHDTVYALLSSHNVGGSDTHGVWRIHPDGTKELFAALDPAGFPNQPLFDARGNLLVADSFLGTIWRITPDGEVSRWITDPLLMPDTAACGFPLPRGANGMAFDDHGNLFVANTNKALIVRIPIHRDGSAGSPSVYASGCANLNGADGITIDVRDNAYVADNILNKVVRVNTNGTIDTLAAPADGLDSPTGVAFGTRRGEQTSLFITNSALLTYLSRGRPRPSLMRLDVGVPGAHATTPISAVARIARSGPGQSGSFTVSFASAAAGQGEVYFGPSCSALVEVATRDEGSGTTLHTVVVTGNDLPGTIGDIGIVPGASYSFEVVTLTPSGMEVDNNGGACYSVTMPSS
jgi:sugar lactone lactonase YvrE